MDDESQRIDCNQLSRSLNPYLRQHSHNPVHWQEWSQHLLDIAIGLKRPLFISIGYSTCHWCHVMEEESFSDPITAKTINRYFISIKIDREERPDLDTYYINAAHLMGVQGGWPLNVFANSEGIPFWICTYAPSVNSYGMVSFKDIVNTLGELWENSSSKIEAQTNKNSQLLKEYFLVDNFLENEKNQINSYEENHDLKEDFFMKQQEFIENHEHYFDEEYGGFKFQARVKFPSLMNLDHLLRLGVHQLSGQKKDPLQSLVMSLKSTWSLVRGGIFDHIGGGLFRYSTDYQWQVPHFEKMLYDNSLFIELLCNTFRATKEIQNHKGINFKAEKLWKQIFAFNYQNSDSNPKEIHSLLVPDFLNEIKQVIRKVVDYFNRDMTVEVNGYRVFFAAQDAGGKESEGEFYSWTIEELSQVLSAEEIRKFHNYFEMYVFSKTKGSFLIGKKIILNQKEKALNDIQRIEAKLFQQRQLREIPFKDNKILVSWNSMMVYSYLHVYEIFGNVECRDRGIETLGFLENNLVTEEGLVKHSVIFENSLEDLLHSSYTLGFLSDYAFLMRAELKAYLVTGKSKYLSRCIRNSEIILKYFYNKRFFSEVSKEHHDTPVNHLTEVHDGVVPGSQSLLAELFLQLDLLYPNKGYFEKTKEIFHQFYDSIGRVNLPYMAKGFYQYQNNLRLICLYGREVDEEFRAFQNFLMEKYIPYSLTLVNPEEYPLVKSSTYKLKSKTRSNKTHIVVCHRNFCSQPIYTISSLEKNLQSTNIL